MRRTGAAAVAALTLATAAGVAALGTGQSFLTLESGYEQELYGVVQLPEDEDGLATVLGGVAFAPDGDVWSAECTFGLSGTRLHRFDAQGSVPPVHGTSTLHPVTSVATSGGCGLVNHPDGTHIYSNSADGVVQLDAATAALTATYPASASRPGNALGIAVDPQTSHVMYAGAACHPTLPARLSFLSRPFESDCKIYDLDPATGAVTDFAVLPPFFIDGIYFDPAGDFLFLANRDPFGSGHRLTILRRPEDSAPFTADPQLVQSVPLPGEPDGVAFHAASPRFVVTNDEEGGTMTKVLFPGDDYTAVPSISPFASGGFRGDLLQVGADGCIYATQGRDLFPTDFAARYDDLTTTTEDSIVRICKVGGGGFEPPPGVEETVDPTPPQNGSLSGIAYVDANGNDMRDPGEQAVPGALLTLSTGATTTSAADGSYSFTTLAAAVYTVSADPIATVPAPIGGSVALGTPASLTATVIANQDAGGNDFGYDPAGLSGVAFLDVNGNGIRDASETTRIAGVPIGLGGTATSSATTTAAGAYAFSLLPGGPYSISAPASFAGLTLTSGSPIARTLAAGGISADNDFGYRDTVNPICAVYSKANPPYMVFQDPGSGIVRLDVAKNLNANYLLTMVPAPETFTPATVTNASPMPTGTVARFNTPVTAPVYVYGHRIDTTQAAQVYVRAYDAAGNTIACDPVETTVTKLRQNRGIQTFTDLPYADHIVTIVNGTPGLRALDVVVNGRLFRARRLDDGEVVRLDVSGAMRQGNDNVVTLVPRGRPGESADVTIAEE